MIKRVVCCENPSYLSLRNHQLEIKLVSNGESKISTVPIEDIGVLMLDNKQLTITQGAMEELLGNNVAVVTCDSKHLPIGLLLPLAGNTVQTERFMEQINASLPLKKQLWQQTMKAKIINQASVLSKVKGEIPKNMLVWAGKVRSGDPDNIEAKAAAFYWKNIFEGFPKFSRDDDVYIQNALLNYGYAILRAIVARALVSSGLLPTLGIHHHNKYDAYCLADDIMEPYRPFVDDYILEIMRTNDFNPEAETILTKEIKLQLLQIPVLDVVICGHRSPLMVAVTTTTASLQRCFAGVDKSISYPVM